MRKIEEQMIAAVEARNNWRCANTEVRVVEDTIRVYLHGNLIFEHSRSGAMFNLQGWATQTTHSRINALARRFGFNGVYTRRGVLFHGGRQIDSTEWVHV